MRIPLLIVLLCCYCWNNSLFAQELAKSAKTIVLDSVPEHLVIEDKVEVYADHTGELSYSEIREQFFIPFHTIQHFNYKKTYWLRFRVQNNSTERLNFWYPLSVADTNKLARVRIPVFKAEKYDRLEGKNPSCRSVAGQASGMRVASYRPHKQYFKFSIDAQETQVYYLRLQYDWRDYASTHRLTPMFISEKERQYQEQLYSQATEPTRIFRFAFIAIALMISLINLAQFFLNQDKAYLAYTSYAFGMCLLYILKYEDALPFCNRVFLGRFFGGWYDYLDLLFFWSVFFSQFLFYKYFFHTKHNYPHLNRKLDIAIQILIIVFAIDISTRFIFGNSLAFGVVHFLLPLLVLIYVLSVVYTVYQMRTRLSSIIVTGSLILSLAGFIGISAHFFPQATLEKFPKLFQNPDNYTPIGAIIEFILFSVALGYRVSLVEAKNLELENTKQIAELRKRLYTDITHEFRTPLTLIISPLQQMLAGTFKGNIQQYQKIMLRNAQRLLQLINQLLDLSKLEAGELRLQASQSDLVQFTRALSMSFESLAMRKQINLQLDLPNTTILAWFDKDKMEKVLTNLLSNAFKFTPEEGTITIRLQVEEQQAVLKIEDSGIGISKEQVPHIFKRFYQVKNEKMQQYEGSGIGLALTREIVELHKGTIQVESKEQEGTCFEIRFPIDDLHLSDEEKIQRPVPLISELAVTPKSTEKDTLQANLPILLVIEDNPDVCQYIVDQLQDTYQIRTAENGKKGVELALQHIPDLIISDVMMPELDGIELCEQLKTNEKTSHIPIIMLTAKADKNDRLEGLQIGADDYLIKPFDSQELLIRAKNLVEQRRQLIERFSKIGSVSIKPIQPVSPEEIFLQKAVAAVEEHLEDEEFGVVELANVLLMSRYQLHRKIKALTDKSPSVFIRSLRLKKAKTLLQQGEFNVSEIAFRLGFNSLAYFSKCFTQEFGQAPSTFIKKPIK